MAAITHVHDCYQARLDDPLADNNGMQDTHFEEEYPDGNFNVSNAHYAGITGGGGKGADYEAHAIYLYDLNAFIPANANITAAVWWFYAQFANTAGTHVFWVERIGEDWKEDEATWNDRLTGVAWTTPGGGGLDPYVNLGAITTVGWKNYNILNIVSDAWDNRGGFCHLLLERTDGGTDQGYISISGKEQHDTHPMYTHHLRITYTLAGRTFQVMLR